MDALQTLLMALGLDTDLTPLDTSMPGGTGMAVLKCLRVPTKPAGSSCHQQRSKVRLPNQRRLNSEATISFYEPVDHETLTDSVDHVLGMTVIAS